MAPTGHPQAPEPPSPDPNRGTPADPAWHQGPDPFPREELTEMVSQAEEARLRRETLQAWLVGLGLAVLALGLPTERLWAAERLVTQVAGEGPSAFGLLVPLGGLLRHLTGLPAERILYLLSAASLGLLVPALRGLLRSIGFPHGMALGCTVAVLLAPGVLLASTLPLGFLPGILGATWLAHSLFVQNQRTKQGYQWRASTLTLLAFLLGAENLLLLPAVAWAVSHHPSARSQPRGLPAFTLLMAVGVAVTILMNSPDGSLHKWEHLLEALLAGGSMEPLAKLTWLLWVPLYLGLAAGGLWVLLLGRRAPEESPPPRWVAPWCLVGLVPLLGGSLDHGPAAGFLLPMAAVGLADGLMRLEREERAWPLLAGLALGQLLLAVGTLAWVRWSDPQAAFRGVARAVLEPEDLVVTQDPAHRYLLTRRWGLRAAGAVDELEPSVTERDTVVFDLWQGGQAPDLPQAGAVLGLTPEGLEPERP